MESHQDHVLSFVEETLIECRAVIGGEDENRLFNSTVMVAACLLALQYLMSASEQQQPILISLFTSLSGIYVALEDQCDIYRWVKYSVCW